MRKSFQIASSLALVVLLLFAPSELSAQRKGKKEKEEKEVSKYDKANAEYLLIDAQKYFLLEDYKRALAFLDQSLEVDPSNHAAYFKKAEILFRTEKYAEALISAEAAIKIHASNRFYYVLAAAIHRQNNRLALAAEQYEQMIRNTKGFKDFLPDLIDLYVLLNDFDNALSTLEKLESMSGPNRKLVLQKINLFVSAGKLNDALDLSLELVRENPEIHQYNLAHADLLGRLNRSEEALQFLEALDAAGEINLALYNLYAQMGQVEKARALLPQILEDSEVAENDRLLLLREWSLQQPDPEAKNSISGFVEDLQSEYASDPVVLKNAGIIFTNLAGGENGEQRDVFVQKAIESYLRVKELDASDFEVWNQILATEYQLGAWEQLLQHGDEALAVFPNQSIFYFYFGAAQLQSGELEDALASLETGRKLARRNPRVQAEIQSKIASVYFMQSKYDQAFETFEKAYNLNKESTDILNTYSFHLALRGQSLERALEMANASLTINHDNLGAYDAKAFVLFKQERFAEARQVIEEGLAKPGISPTGDVIERYGDILIKLGRADEALAQWQRAWQLGNTSDKIEQKIADKAYNE